MPSSILVTLKFIGNPRFNPAVGNAFDFLDARQFEPCKLKWKCEFVATPFVSQTVFVSRLEQSRPDVSVDFIRTTDHAIRKLVEHIFVLFVVTFAPWTYSQ